MLIPSDWVELHVFSPKLLIRITRPSRQKPIHDLRPWTGWRCIVWTGVRVRWHLINVSFRKRVGLSWSSRWGVWVGSQTPPAPTRGKAWTEAQVCCLCSPVRSLPVGSCRSLRALPFSSKLYGTHNLRMLSFLTITQKGMNNEFCVENLGGCARFN